MSDRVKKWTSGGSAVARSHFLGRLGLARPLAFRSRRHSSSSSSEKSIPWSSRCIIVTRRRNESLCYGFYRRLLPERGGLVRPARSVIEALEQIATFSADVAQILNDLSCFYRHTADHDPKSKVDFQRDDHRASPFIARFRIRPYEEDNLSEITKVPA
jgi:hypothetical protein